MPASRATGASRGSVALLAVARGRTLSRRGRLARRPPALRSRLLRRSGYGYEGRTLRRAEKRCGGAGRGRCRAQGMLPPATDPLRIRTAAKRNRNRTVTDQKGRASFASISLPITTAVSEGHASGLRSRPSFARRSGLREGGSGCSRASQGGEEVWRGRVRTPAGPSPVTDRNRTPTGASPIHNRPVCTIRNPGHSRPHSTARNAGARPLRVCASSPWRRALGQARQTYGGQAHQRRASFAPACGRRFSEGHGPSWPGISSDGLERAWSGKVDSSRGGRYDGSSAAERCPSGRWSTVGNRVFGETRTGGSTPPLSATFGVSDRLRSCLRCRAAGSTLCANRRR